MKRKIRLSCAILSLLLLLCACGSQNTQPDSDQDVSNNTVGTGTSLYESAIIILDEFDDPSVNDFKEAYALLMDLPDGKDDFIDQLHIVNSIFERNDVEFQYGGWYLQPYLSDDSITQDGMTEYRDKQVYYDIKEFLEACIYPLVFEKYGYDAWSIHGINVSSVTAAIKTDPDYSCSGIEESFSTCSEKWTYNDAPSNTNYQYKITYHKNGLIQHLIIPIVRHEQPMDESVFESFLDFEPSEQKKIAENRFATLLSQMDSGLIGYDVLCQIYSEEEIGVICNYLKSVLPAIWESSMNTEEEVRYFGTSIWFKYKGNTIIASFGLNSLQLQISGRNYVNQLSHKWDTIYCGLGYPVDADISQYQDNIEYDLSANTEIYDYEFDLDAHESDYMGEFSVSGNQNGSDDTSSEIFVLSMSDTITVEGFIEENSDAFPLYRFKLVEPIHIILKEFDEEFIYEYLYFYDDEELNGGVDYASLVDSRCSVTASVENYRGGGNLFLLNPIISIGDQNQDN